MLELVLPYTAQVFGRAMVMPNLTEQGMVVDPEHVGDYYYAIHGVCCQHELQDRFTPFMTLRLVPETTPETVAKAFEAGAIAGKLYPDGVTTGAEGGVTDFKALYPVFESMQELGMVLSIHCEMPGSTEQDAEVDFINILVDLVRNFGKLRIVVEHVTTSTMIDFLLQQPETVGATITAHHLVLTRDHVYLGKTLGWPHHFCKPVAKTKQDQEALVWAAISGNPRFWFGSDSAPHLKTKKECVKPAAGVFSAPVALPVLATIFEAADALDRLEDFVARFGAEFYQVPLNKGTISIEKRSWRVPKLVGGKVVPFLAGSRLDWQIV